MKIRWIARSLLGLVNAWPGLHSSMGSTTLGPSQDKVCLNLTKKNGVRCWLLCSGHRFTRKRMAACINSTGRRQALAGHSFSRIELTRTVCRHPEAKLRSDTSCSTIAFTNLFRKCKGAVWKHRHHWTYRHTTYSLCSLARVSCMEA